MVRRVVGSDTLAVELELPQEDDKLGRYFESRFCTVRTLEQRAQYLGSERCNLIDSD